jgi:hypothetical protein
MEHVVDEAGGEVEEELTPQRFQSPFDAHPIVEDAVEHEVADLPRKPFLPLAKSLPPGIVVLIVPKKIPLRRMKSSNPPGMSCCETVPPTRPDPAFPLGPYPFLGINSRSVRRSCRSRVGLDGGKNARFDKSLEVAFHLAGQLAAGDQ